ncbi:ABC transporter ATP-binding protein [Phytoactinopolyspora halotolerans]|uniref:ABC transporter ATP-binding protein n=1 Tax=Phytoactinopolyspora halotolerans TaxID=1981512 RepID=A0A6L9SBG8_9ACTN|nr:ABC transporter ATP-binding protein [Phytoactinopolyspora halotolerans]NEE01932.1 ABC transporter ATP-binding protein [Phytoactinopolyspora halotolerans]
MTIDHDVLAARDLRVRYGPRTVLDGLAADVGRGEMLALVGPNGSGKSTLLRALARLLDADAGTVLLDGADIARLPTVEVARRLAVLPQGPVPPGGVTVRELVEHGRFPHRSALARVTADDRRAVDEALELTGLSAYAERYVDRLSGGERQRAWIALTIAQETPVLLLDEPTTFLDMGHQLEVLDLVARLRRDRRLTVVLVLHDLNQAAHYCDRIIALSDGRVVADGAPADVVTEDFLAERFGVRATVTADPVTGSVVCLPYAAVR